VTISYTASSRRGLKQKSKDIGSLGSSKTADKQSRLELSKDDNDERYLQATRQSIVFDRCLFQGNKQGVNGGENLGVMSIVSTASDVVIKNSIFRDNVFADTQRVRATVCDCDQRISIIAQCKQALTKASFLHSRIMDTLPPISSLDQH
jgi:hypothetical protein